MKADFIYIHVASVSHFAYLVAGNSYLIGLKSVFAEIFENLIILREVRFNSKR